MAKSQRTERDLCIAARAGDPSACRALLCLYGHKDLARDVRAGKPLTRRARVMVGALTAGWGTEWEYVSERGETANLLNEETGATWR